MKVTTRTLMYTVNVGYYDFAFCDPNKTMDFAREAMRNNIEGDGIRVSIELIWEETDDQDEDDEETFVDIEVLREGGETE